MVFNVIHDKVTWDNMYNMISSCNRDVYFTYDYCKLYDDIGEGIANSAIFIGDKGQRLVYPFLLKKINGYETDQQFYDIESCYGYGGPIVESYNEQDMRDFEEHFCCWCLNNNVVAEFIRFYPILNNQVCFKQNILIEKNRSTVYIDLEKGIESIWKDSISSKNRNMIRKAEKLGVKVKEGNSFEKFIEIYLATMESLGATQYYYFNKQYFENLFKLGHDKMFLLEATVDSEIISSAVFLCSDDYISYHLAGSNHNFLGHAPNNLLLFKAIQLACQRGYKRFHLGGGTKETLEDSLFKFKKSFSKETCDFYIGKRIHNQNIYMKLINEWQKMNNKEVKLFLQYNY